MKRVQSRNYCLRTTEFQHQVEDDAVKRRAIILDTGRFDVHPYRPLPMIASSNCPIIFGQENFSDTRRRADSPILVRSFSELSRFRTTSTNSRALEQIMISLPGVASIPSFPIRVVTTGRPAYMASSILFFSPPPIHSGKTNTST